MESTKLSALYKCHPKQYAGTVVWGQGEKREHENQTTTYTKQVCIAAKQLVEQTSPVLSPRSPLILPPAASTILSCAFLLRSQGACYSSSNSTWQGDLCPTQDGLNWGGRGGGAGGGFSSCPVSSPMVSAAPSPPPDNVQTPRLHS